MSLVKIVAYIIFDFVVHIICFGFIFVQIFIPLVIRIPMSWCAFRFKINKKQEHTQTQTRSKFYFFYTNLQ